MQIEFTVEKVKAIKTGILYRVLHDGEVIIKSTRNPEYDACRWALGKADIAAFRKPGTAIYMTMNIEKCSKLTISETETRPARVVKWKPYVQTNEENSECETEPA